MRILKNTWEPNHEKNRLLQITLTKKLENVYKFFNITKAPKFKEKNFPANWVSKCSQNNRQVIIG